MKNLQETFNKQADLKSEQKTLRSSYKDALSHSADYQAALETVQKNKLAKQALEEGIKGDFRPEFNRLEEIKNELGELAVQISDIALSQIMKGERVELYGPHEVQYEPILNVKFKRKQN